MIHSLMCRGFARWALGSLLALSPMMLQAQAQAQSPGLARTLKLALDANSGAYCTDAGLYCLQMTAADVISYAGPNGLSGQLSGLPLRQGEAALPAAQLIEISPGRILLGVEFSGEILTEDGRMQRRDAVFWDVDMQDGSVLGPVLEFTAHVGIDTNNCQNWPQERQTGGCAARYVFNSIVDAIGATRDGYPVLTYRTAAVITPPGASREYGWTTPTSVSSDGQELHMNCTFRRSYIFNPLSGRYMLDQPLPDCDQFLSADLLPRRSRDEIAELQMRPATQAEVDNFASYAPDLAARLGDPATQVELGWLYNEMVTGADVIVLRVSQGGRCDGDSGCALMFFGTANCVEPALCRPKWQQSRAANRVYTVQNPRAPLSQACPEGLLLLPAGRDRGQHCLIWEGLAAEGAIPEPLVAMLSQS